MKYVFVNNQLESYIGIPYNIIDANNTEYPGYPKKGSHTEMGRSFLYYLNNDETSILRIDVYEQTPIIEECKVINVNTNHLVAEAITESVTFKFYKVAIKHNLYMADLTFMSILVIIENNIMYPADLNGEKIEPEQPVDLNGIITWYDEPTHEDPNSGLKRIIRKLPLRLDVKNKIIKYVFGEEKQNDSPISRIGINRNYTNTEKISLQEFVNKLNVNNILKDK